MNLILALALKLVKMIVCLIILLCLMSCSKKSGNADAAEAAPIIVNDLPDGLELIIAGVPYELHDGKKGNDGRAGSSGSQGIPGIQGPPGDSTGTQGPPGRDGDRGPPGVQGLPGRNGVDGRDGVSNVPGPPGPEGKAGRDSAVISKVNNCIIHVNTAITADYSQFLYSDGFVSVQVILSTKSPVDFYTNAVLYSPASPFLDLLPIDAFDFVITVVNSEEVKVKNRITSWTGNYLCDQT